MIFSNELSGDKKLYIAEELSEAWSSFLLPPDSSYADKTIDLEASLNTITGGCFIFSSCIPSDIKDFVCRIRDFLPTVRSQYTVNTIVWLENPEDISAKTTDVVNITGVPADFRTEKDVNFYLGNNFITLYIKPNTKIELDQGKNGLVLILDSDNFTFKTNYTDSNAKVKSNIWLQFSGDFRGCLQYELGLNQGDDFDKFDIREKFFYQAGDTVTELSYPVFKQGGSNDWVLFRMTLDLLDILNASGKMRTFLAFTGSTLTPDGDNGTVPTDLVSFFTTVGGAEIHLIPVADLKTAKQNRVPFIPGENSAMLVFSERKRGSNQTCYLTLRGDFYLGKIKQESISVSTGQFKLLGGLSGTEFFRVTPEDVKQNCDIIRFIPGKPAYAPVFPLDPVSDFDYVPKDQLLNDTFITSWVSVVSGGQHPVLFCVQPESGVLYTKAALGNDAGPHPDLLHPYFPAVQFPKDVCFPMVPYMGCFNMAHTKEGLPPDNCPNNAVEDISKFEFQIINPIRNKQILSSSTPASQSGKISAVNSQGTIVTVEQNGSWQEILFAKNGGNELKFTGFGIELQQAFQANQQFMVISNNKRLGTFNNRLSIENWTFDINVPEKTNYGNYSNILIFKFCQGTIADLAKNPASWTRAADFSSEDELTIICRWMQDYIAKAEMEASCAAGDSPFEKFNTVVTNPNWNGILILKADIDLEQMPVELQGLLGGMDCDRFYAHHLGIEINQAAVNDKDEIIFKEDSSVFGLIHYLDIAYEAQLESGQSPDEPVPAVPGCIYDFKVLSLQLLLENSKIKDFKSKAQLTLNEFFSDKVTKTTVGGVDCPFNSIVFNGSCQKHGNDNQAPVYVFDTSAPVRFDFDSNILLSVNIDKAQFNTVQNQDSQGSGIVNSRFLFRGKLQFNLLNWKEEPGGTNHNFDIFSFGPEIGPDTDGGSGLIFSNLAVKMDFNINTPTIKTFAFETEGVSMNPAQSNLRQKSLYHNFSLQLNRLVSGTGEVNPQGMGYIDVRMPDLSCGGLGGTWYGMEYTLNLGTPGALASQAGFCSTLLIAWSPGSRREDGSYNVYLGLKLPGTEGAKIFGIQGVLKIGIASIELFYVDKECSFLLKLNDIALKLLGLLKIPPGATTSFYLFGDPEGNPKGLGWYAAYNKDETTQRIQTQLK